MTPDTYVYDRFFIELVETILDGNGTNPPPVEKTIFGVPLRYSRTENRKDDPSIANATYLASWTYVIERVGVWALTMENYPSAAESTFELKATGDLEAARRDLSLMKLAIN